MSESALALDHQRREFEHSVFHQYFIKSIKNGENGPKLNSDTLDLQQLCKKDDKGDYVRKDISAMWFGFNLGANLMKKEVERLENKLNDFTNMF